jgi:predicted anti-sigma-YlaC factor YlaD
MNSSNCTQEILLSAYLDGELSGNDLQHMEEHLVGCRNCRDGSARMKADRDVLLECLPDLAPPEYVKQKLFRKINEATENRRHVGVRAWIGIGYILPFRSKAWITACASIMMFAVMLSVFQYQRRLENNKILAEIDHSRAEWSAHGLSRNPFDIASREEKLRNSRENPFQSYLNER